MAKQRTEKEIKRMPGEFTPDVIYIGADCRTSLQYYYAIGGGQDAFALFKGVVAQVVPSKGYLFKELFVAFDNISYNAFDEIRTSENHVWVYDYKPLEKNGVKVGDKVEFTALAYAYRRKDGSEDYALKALQDIRKIEDYALPEEPEELSDEFLESLVCETCMYTNHCYGFHCIAPAGYKEQRVSALKAVANQ